MNEGTKGIEGTLVKVNRDSDESTYTHTLFNYISREFDFMKGNTWEVYKVRPMRDTFFLK